MAAAMSNVDQRDNWKVHFRDTMRGGKFLNDWRMAEPTPGRRPTACRARRVGRGLRSHQGRAHRSGTSAAPLSTRSRVGDRTGLELIRTLQDHGVHSGISFRTSAALEFY
jgi:succinate dehydrogenase / fumarate reductase flavoprotein subunit